MDNETSRSLASDSSPTEEVTVTVNVSTKLTAIIEFGHRLKEGTIGKNATAKVVLYRGFQKIAEAASDNPGFAIKGSTSVGMIPGQDYIFRAVATNSDATTESTWIKASVVLVNDCVA